MLVLISRLVEQKGLDLLTFMLEELLREDLQLVICGVGDEKYRVRLPLLGRTGCPRKLSANILFSEPLSRKLYAAGDIAPHALAVRALWPEPDDLPCAMARCRWCGRPAD